MDREKAGRLGKRLVVVSFLLFGFSFLVVMVIVSIYGQDWNKFVVPYTIDVIASLSVVIASPVLFAIGGIMCLYGRRRTGARPASSPTTLPSGEKILEKKSPETWTRYQKVSLIVSAISILISIILRIFVK